MKRDNRAARPVLPEAIARLDELAYNLWWTWQHEAQELFRLLDSQTWESSNHNPVAVVRAASPAQLQIRAEDEGYLGKYRAVLAAFDAYMDPHAATWYARTYPNDPGLIAYFCTEFGLHESLPIYSGGLGVLAGDHCKAASDLGLPLVAVGLWYTQGYFRQRIDASGAQIAAPEDIDKHLEPLLPAGAKGEEVVISIELAARTIQARVWRLQVGRVPIYLLDTDLPGNSDADRALCAHLYGGDRETRIAQEKVLGVGGVRALRALGLKPTRWHMNEGHAAFMGLERIREMVESGIRFVDAWPDEAEASVFTTHTPVPAGNEVFRYDLVRRYFADFPAQMGLDMQGFLNLGHEEGAPDDTFAMTPLALRLSHRANGVSALHGAVARHMWAKQFPQLEEAAVPITSITNGVHSPTWIAPSLRTLFDRYLGADWLSRVDDAEVWEKLARIPDSELWAAHRALKAELIAVVRRRQVSSDGQGDAKGSAAAPTLDPDVLTIGFARRFATYKRATLIFHDPLRAARILGNKARPVQIVFAGKAHPADGGGQALIESIVELSRTPGFEGRVCFLEGYDMGLARTMVQGVDLWLNNPERPQEASGTSGQKASLNGVPNCSIRDGWWDEAYNGRNGWAFGGEVGDDEVDSEQLYAVLEESVIPTYYTRDATGSPGRWLTVMREAIRSIAPAFSAQRMVKEYTQRFYR